MAQSPIQKLRNYCYTYLPGINIIDCGWVQWEISSCDKNIMAKVARKAILLGMKISWKNETMYVTY